MDHFILPIPPAMHHLDPLRRKHIHITFTSPYPRPDHGISMPLAYNWIEFAGFNDDFLTTIQTPLLHHIANHIDFSLYFSLLDDPVQQSYLVSTPNEYDIYDIRMPEKGHYFTWGQIQLTSYGFLLRGDPSIPIFIVDTQTKQTPSILAAE